MPRRRGGPHAAWAPPDGARSGTDDATRSIGGHFRVVEPDTTRAEVAEAHVLAGRHGHARTARAVGAPHQLVRAGAPVVEGADGGHRAVMHVVRKDERKLRFARFLIDAHANCHRKLPPAIRCAAAPACVACPVSYRVGLTPTDTP